MFDSNDDHTTKEISNHGIPRFLRLPLSRSESYSSVDSVDSLSLFIGDLDNLAKSLFCGEWIDDKTPSQNVIPSANSISDAGVMDLINRTMTDFEQTPLQLDDFNKQDTQQRSSRLSEPGRPYLEMDTIQMPTQSRIREEDGMLNCQNQKTHFHSSHPTPFADPSFRPKRIPRRRQRVKNAKIAQTERLIDFIRAGAVTLVCLSTSAIFYSQSIWEKSFVWKAIGVLAICFLSTVSLDDPRGDKANVVTIVYSRKTALLITYVWIWINAVDLTSKSFSTIADPYFAEWNIPTKDIFLTLKHANSNDGAFLSDPPTIHNFTTATFGIHEFMAIMETSVVEDSKPFAKTEFTAEMEESGFEGQSSAITNDTQYALEEANEREFNIRGHSSSHVTKSLRTIKLVTRPLIMKRPLLQTRKEEGMDEIVTKDNHELENIETSTNLNPLPSTDDTTSSGDAYKMIGFAILCTRVLTLVNELRHPLYHGLDCVVPVDIDIGVYHNKELAKHHPASFLTNVANRKMTILNTDSMAVSTDEIPSFEMDTHPYTLNRFHGILGLFGRQVRAGMRVFQKFLSFLLGNGGSPMYQQISDEIADYWYSVHW